MKFVRGIRMFGRPSSRMRGTAKRRHEIAVLTTLVQGTLYGWQGCLRAQCKQGSLSRNWLRLRPSESSQTGQRCSRKSSAFSSCQPLETGLRLLESPSQLLTLPASPLAAVTAGVPGSVLVGPLCSVLAILGLASEHASCQPLPCTCCRSAQPSRLHA